MAHAALSMTPQTAEQWLFLEEAIRLRSVF